MKGFKLNTKKLSYFNKAFLAANFFAILALLLAYTTTFLNPHDYYFPAFFGLVYPIILLINVLFAAYWALQWRWQAFLSVIAILIGINNVGNLLRLNISKDVVDKSALKIVSYNVKVFDLYEQEITKKNRNEIFKLLQEQDADIVNLQEFYNNDILGKFKTHDTLINLIDAKDFNVAYTKTVGDVQHFGIITYSKFPIVAKGKIEFGEGENNICIFSDIHKGKDTIRVYNCHFQSIHISTRKTDFISKVENNKPVTISDLNLVYDRIKLAYQKRGVQVDSVFNHIKNSPYKVILTGDFNDPPCSYTYKKFSELLKDNFVEKGSGFGQTYSWLFPPLRIDYIFTDENFKCQAFEVNKEDFSDHFLINSTLKLN